MQFTVERKKNNMPLFQALKRPKFSTSLLFFRFIIVLRELTLWGYQHQHDMNRISSGIYIIRCGWIFFLSPSSDASRHTSPRIKVRSRRVEIIFSPRSKTWNLKDGSEYYLPRERFQNHSWQIWHTDTYNISLYVCEMNSLMSYCIR